MAKQTATTEQIETLRREALAASDTRQVAMCDRALAGSDRAIIGCTKAILGARHEQSVSRARELASQRALEARGLSECDAETWAHLFDEQ